jgi:dimeric dUTPase (all-alpha-NTP-PPase superfamily)
MIESRVVELGELANNTLRSGQMWSLDRLVLHLVNTILQFGFTCIYYVLSIKSSQVRIQ